MNRLLIVDDAMIMRKIIRDVALSAGWEVVAEATDGRQGVELYRSLRPDLVTMDLVMPEMGGIEALRLIRADDPEARVLVVTALDQKEMVADSIGAGALDFIVKPFDRDRMRGLLTKLRRPVRP
ncbi:response regulator [Tautonia plasticadhaerens]|uniref:Chemotaxis protein CheY n=1 Tax=Tautonia plasticadhaerens TaxID=2527974 RepID=A0A518H7V3_9BACT|nr:response regulator [Tautonia plasticadhaerens]QDV36846.1 Chemotaxis protein CheY [Tautonia plasticadhaerens]